MGIKTKLPETFHSLNHIINNVAFHFVPPQAQVILEMNHLSTQFHVNLTETKTSMIQLGRLPNKSNENS